MCRLLTFNSIYHMSCHEKTSGLFFLTHLPLNPFSSSDALVSTRTIHPRGHFAICKCNFYGFTRKVNASKNRKRGVRRERASERNGLKELILMHSSSINLELCKSQFASGEKYLFKTELLDHSRLYLVSRYSHWHFWPCNLVQL